MNKAHEFIRGSKKNRDINGFNHLPAQYFPEKIEKPLKRLKNKLFPVPRINSWALFAKKIPNLFIF